MRTVTSFQLGRSGLRAELLWTAVSPVASLLATLATLKLASASMGPGPYGYFAAAHAISSIIVVCLFGPISQIVLRFAPLAAAGGMSYFASVVLLLLGAPPLVISALAGPVYAMLLDTPLRSLVVPAVVLGGLLGFQNVFFSLLNAGRQRKPVALASIADLAARVAILTILVATGQCSELNLLLSLAVASLISCALLLPRLCQYLSELERHPAEGLFKESLRSMSLYGGAFLVFGVVGVIGSHGERLILMYAAAIEDVGRYAVAYQLANAPLVFVFSVVNGYYLPILFANQPVGVHNALRKHAKISLLVTGLIALFMALAGPFVLALLSATSFLDSWLLIPLLVLASGVFNIGQQLIVQGLARNQPYRYLLPKLFHSLSFLALALILVPQYNTLGLASSQLISALCFLGLVLFTNHRMQKTGSAAMRKGGDDAE